MPVELDVQHPAFDAATVPFEALAQAVCGAELGLVPEISLVLTTDDGIAPINVEWLGHTGPTDVISFPQHELLPAGGPGRLTQADLLGDIVISVDRAADQAPDEPGWSRESEVALLFVHGLLHLCGYDDHEPADRALMQAAEDAALTACGLPPAPRPPAGL